MKIMVIGSGGREHALAWCLAKSDHVSDVYIAPGNPGTATEHKCTNVAIAVDDFEALIDFAKQQQIDLTVVGPEAPLVAGIVDAFGQAGLKCFGPSMRAARLEGSKVCMKDFLKDHHIPTADYGVFTEVEAAKAFAKKLDSSMVIKADGLAAGKGVIIAHSQQEAFAAIDEMLVEKRFGQACQKIVIEEFLSGIEASFMVVASGEDYVVLPTSQDHKARDEGNKGPNTGGMGAYSPAPVVTDAVYQKVIERVIEPTLKGLVDSGAPYTGFLYAGLMIDEQGDPQVLEYNCRLGDPETQVLLLRLKSSLAALCLASIMGQLDRVKVEWDPRPAVGVVLAAAGYPLNYPKGDVITGLDSDLNADQKVFHAGTAVNDNQQVVSNGGRVLCCTALANGIEAARASAYEVVKQISWKHCYYRKDIAANF